MGLSSKHEGEVNDEGTGAEAEDQWWTTSLLRKRGRKASRQWSMSLLKAKCAKLAHNGLVWGNDVAKKQEDHG